MEAQAFHHTGGARGAKWAHWYRNVALASYRSLREDLARGKGSWGGARWRPTWEVSYLANSPPLLEHDPPSWAHAQPYGRGLGLKTRLNFVQAWKRQRLHWSKKSCAIDVCGWSAGPRPTAAPAESSHWCFSEKEHFCSMWGSDWSQCEGNEGMKKKKSPVLFNAAVDKRDKQSFNL